MKIRSKFLLAECLVAGLAFQLPVVYLNLVHHHLTNGAAFKLAGLMIYSYLVGSVSARVFDFLRTPR